MKFIHSSAIPIELFLLILCIMLKLLKKNRQIIFRLLNWNVFIVEKFENYKKYIKKKIKIAGNSSIKLLLTKTIWYIFYQTFLIINILVYHILFSVLSLFFFLTYSLNVSQNSFYQFSNILSHSLGFGKPWHIDLCSNVVLF